MNYFNLTGFKLLITTLFFSININAQVFQYRGILQNSFTLGTYHKDVVVGDVNNDGLLDLYMPQLQFSGNSTITDHIYLNNGIGFTGGINNLTNDFTFEPTNIAFPNATQIMTDRGYDGELLDLDSDGNLDIIRPDRTVVYVVYGNGDGTFEEVDILNAIGDPNFGKNYDDADFADLDNDGDIDKINLNILKTLSNVTFIVTSNENVEYIYNSELEHENILLKMYKNHALGKVE